MNEEVDPSLSLKKKGGKVPMLIVAVLAVGGIAFFVVRAMQTRAHRELHAQFIEAFAGIEKEELGKFWTCVFGPNVDPAMFPDNLALSARVSAAFGTDAKHYPAKVREECTPKAIDAKHKIDDLKGPAEYTEALKKYSDALKDLSNTFDAWTQVAPAQVQDMEEAKALDKTGGAWHAFGGGKPDNDVLNYDAFLRCAVPDVDKLKDGQALVEELAKSFKDQKYLEKLNDECAQKLIAESPPAAAKAFAATQKKLAADDRELQAFGDGLRKARKGKRRDDLAEVGKAWIAWLEAGRAIRKIGAEQLKD
jgi:hypothetical protein